jgi:putative toxin-antitoxin system antitoxin component (TIGR02293 family)
VVYIGPFCATIKATWLFSGNLIMISTDSIISLWGGPAILGCIIHSENELIPLLRQGLPFIALEKLMEAFSLSRDEISGILNLPVRTLTRRKQSQRLESAESDRLYRLSRVLAHAENVLGSRSRATQWLHRPNGALNGVTPLGLLDTDIGAHQVDDVLGRLEHGIFS